MTYQFDPILGTGRDGKVTLAEQQAGFNSGTAAQKAAFQSSVSGAVKPGRVWGFAGTSLTNGSTASNFAQSYTAIAARSAGAMVCASNYVEAGTPGAQADVILALMKTDATAGYGIDAWSIEVGTNDAGNLVTTVEFETRLRACIAQAVLGAPNRSFIVLEVPPRASSLAAGIHALIQGYNAIIRTIVPKLGGIVVPVYDTLADPATGYLLAAYDSSDGTHWNNLGHLRVGLLVADAMVAACGAPGHMRTWIRSPLMSITSDPLGQRASANGGTWFEQPGGSGTAPVYSMEADTMGILPAGKWAKMAFDGTVSGGNRRLATAASTGFSVGDTVLFSGLVQIDDVSGTWEAGNAAGTSQAYMQLLNQSAVNIVGDVILQCPGRRIAPGKYLIPVHTTAVVPAGTTQLLLWCSLKVATGASAVMRLGCVGISNLTTMGLLPYVSGPVVNT